MKFLFALLSLTPLLYCATLTHEEQLIIQAMTETQKRALIPKSKMKFCLALLALLPFVYCAEMDISNIDMDSLTEEQKRFLFHIPSLDEIKNAICGVISSDLGHTTCETACPVALAAIPGGSFASSLCGPACQSIHC